MFISENNKKNLLLIFLKTKPYQKATSANSNIVLVILISYLELDIIIICSGKYTMFMVFSVLINPALGPTLVQWNNPSQFNKISFIFVAYNLMI